MDYIDFMNAGIPPHLLPPDNHLYCNRCYHHGYVSDGEMQFLKENRHIINNHIRIPYSPPKPNFDETPISYERRENVYVSEFCPVCERERFGELSDWRE